MAICDDIRVAISTRRETQIDKAVCEKYEAANILFEQLVAKGTIAKRGYRLLPIENQIHDDLKVNHSNNL